MRPRIYIDTSVIGGCFDKEFREDSLKLFEEVIRGKNVFVISDLLLFELEPAPQKVRDQLKKLPEESVEHVALDKESIRLAEAYITAEAVAEHSRSDAQHITLATVHRVGVLVSWNFRHIVNINRIHLINSVNLKLGYPLLEIRSPKEVYGM